MWGDYSGITLDVKLIGGAPYDPLYVVLQNILEICLLEQKLIT
jgi:hypothetical protein